MLNEWTVAIGIIGGLVIVFFGKDKVKEWVKAFRETKEELTS